MWPIWALAAVAGVMPEVTVEAGGQARSVPILLMSPPGFASELRGSDVLSATALVLDRVSGVRGLSPEQAGLALDALDRCALSERFACAMRLVRDLPRSARSSGWAVLVLRRPASGGDERLDLQLIDVERAADALARPPPNLPLEDAIFQHARALPPVLRRDARDAAELADAMEAAIATALAAIIPRAPSGRVELQLACAPCELALDGRVVAQIDGPQLALVAVPIGTHHLTLRREQRARDYPIEVGDAQTLALDARDFGVTSGAVPRPWLLITGGVALAGGATLIAVARATSSGVVCLESASGRCPDPGPWARVDGDPLVAAPAFDPLFFTGATLAGAGASWGAAGLVSDGLDPLWATLIAVAGASIGATVAIAGGLP